MSGAPQPPFNLAAALQPATSMPPGAVMTGPTPVAVITGPPPAVGLPGQPRPLLFTQTPVSL